MSQAARLAYAERLMTFADRMRDEGDAYSAEVNAWMAGNYSDTAERREFLERSLRDD